MNADKLQKLFENVNGTSIVSIDTVTIPKLSGGKKNPFQGRVHKVMMGGNVIVFATKPGVSGYENMVNRRLEQEGFEPGSFTVGPRSWGQRIQGTPFVEHNGQQYLEVIFLRAGKSHYEVDGRVVDPTAIEGLDLDRPETAEQGGLVNKVVIRTFKADSIAAVTINGERHTL